MKLLAKAVSFVSLPNAGRRIGFDYVILVSGFRPFPNPYPHLSQISFVGNFLHNIPGPSGGGQCLPARFPLPQTRDTDMCACRARIGYAGIHRVSDFSQQLCARQPYPTACVPAVSQKSRETTGETWLCLELGTKSPVGIEETTVKGSLVGVGLLIQCTRHRDDRY